MPADGGKQPLDPATIPKYVEPLFILPPQPPTLRRRDLPPADQGSLPFDTAYEMAAVQLSQQVLPAGYPPTAVWGYGSIAPPPGGTFHYPAFTVEARVDERVRVTWINNLTDGDHYLPHLLPVDQTLHWANPGRDCGDGRDRTDCQGISPLPYLGPVPLVTHVHGVHVEPVSDGYPEAWFLPDGDDIAGQWSSRGSRYGSVVPAPPGRAIYEYRNDQRATTLWYHDHALGITRLNIYAGLAGFWILRDTVEDSLGLPAPAPRLGDPPDAKVYEIPLMIQDRSFYRDGSLFYPRDRAFFAGLTRHGLRINFRPNSDVPPAWNPEFFGNTIVVNGRTWPYLHVEPRRYRFRLLNAANSRFLVLELDSGQPFYQIGADGGLLPEVAVLERILLAPAERADVIVDFAGLVPGTEVMLLNLGPDEPFGGGIPGVDFAPANPATTGQVMKFVVVPSSGPDLSTPPRQLVLPLRVPLPAATSAQKVSLNEQESDKVCVEVSGDGVIRQLQAVWPGPTFARDCAAAGGEIFGPTAAFLGTVDATGTPESHHWGAPISENPALGSTEIWEMYNFTEDAHPIHLHLVQFEVVERQAFTGQPVPPEPGERGTKDTVIAYPEQITRVKATFDLEGLYLWHCHILEHEDNEMMRPYRVAAPVPPPPPPDPPPPMPPPP